MKFLCKHFNIHEWKYLSMNTILRQGGMTIDCLWLAEWCIHCGATRLIRNPGCSEEDWKKALLWQIEFHKPKKPELKLVKKEVI